MPVVSLEPGLGDGAPDPGWLADRLGEVLAQLGTGNGAGGLRSVSVRIVGDETMARLHGRHLDDPATTDVLTFVLPVEPDPGGRIGADTACSIDLVLCLDEARRQSAARAHSVERELLLYAVHGLLHGLGHDDREPAEAAAMHAEEDRLLEAIGIGATFAREARR